MRTYEAVVEAVLATEQIQSFVTSRRPELDIDLGGIPGDRHYGLLRAADSRQRFYRRGTMIANRRQLSLLAAEECDVVASALGVPELRPEWLGANVLLRGYPSLTMLPQGARLIFASGAGLIGEGENEPCIGPGQVIAEAYGRPELARRFVKAAMQKRGIVASVELPGTIREGDRVTIMIP
ncbi:molybdenum cofactor sulfurase [Gordoniibacillus kamchatkensis]|uniref:Molybdenum cofactor sulfurase n=1 Tax=Gordoniibacillus kamchatkensis TaxID=1590651 RepID=A0ABR5AEJ7_9BACL|nr:MOSC domain-containing protein [Paenibacillus sp. VKM B-2647]KIL39466.1 molybdenum cofactor sulfurase [Paenibacillus sp. VKM B-2647]